LSPHESRPYPAVDAGGISRQAPGAMRVAGIREIRSNMAELLGGNEAVLVTRRGKISGLYLPLRDVDRIPPELRRELGQVLSAHLARHLAANGRTEEEIQQDFDAFRRRRR
jgi:hypothetical protein